MAKLKECLYYLESKPNQSFLEEQLVSLEKKLKLIDEGFKPWVKTQLQGKTIQQFKTTYSTLMETKKVKAQIKTLKFILE